MFGAAIPRIIQFPSVGYKKAQVVKAIISSQILENYHINNLGKEFMNHLFRAPLASLEPSFTTIQDLRDFLFSHHFNMEFNPIEMIPLVASVAIDIIGRKKEGPQKTITLNGDVQLIKIPSHQLQSVMNAYRNRSLQEGKVEPNTMSLNDVFDALTDGATVTEPGVRVVKTSVHYGETSGRLHRHCHSKDYFFPSLQPASGVRVTMFIATPVEFVTRHGYEIFYK